jgi:hypothetical protein
MKTKKIAMILPNTVMWCVGTIVFCVGVPVRLLGKTLVGAGKKMKA